VAGSEAIAASVEAGRDYVRQATDAAARVDDPDLRRALGEVVSSLLEGLVPA
jgi:hypothetical protein